MKRPVWQRRLVGHCLVLVVVLLPALAAGSRIDAAPAAGEWQRAVQAWMPAALAPASLVADGFYRAVASHAARSCWSSAAGTLALAVAR